jgi:transposase
MYRCSSWSEKNIHPYNEYMMGQRISELLNQITKDEIEHFNYLWLTRIVEKDNLCYDITSISSYSQNIEYIRHGYNRDCEKLPQINLAVLYGQKSGLPTYYRRLPGNITDVITLENTIKTLNYLGVKNINFILDRGFYSIKNISEMFLKRHNFIIALPIDRVWVKQAIDLYRNDIENINNFYEFDDEEIIYFKKHIFKWSSPQRRLYLHIYFNNKKKADDINDLLKNIITLKNQFVEGKIDKKLELKYKKYLTIKNKKDDRIIVTINNQMIEDYKNRYTGFFCLLSSNSNDPLETLLIYRKRDMVENSFDDLKNHLDTKRLRIHSSQAMDSKLFIHFIALIIKSEIRKIAKNDPKIKYLSICEIFDELSLLCKTTFKSRYGELYSEITPKATKILECFGLCWPPK